MSDAFQLEELDGSIALLTLNLPEKKVNTLSQAVLAELAKWIGQLAKRTDLRDCCSGAASPVNSSPGPTSRSSHHSRTPPRAGGAGDRLRPQAL